MGNLLNIYLKEFRRNSLINFYDHEKLDVGSKEIIEENTSKDSIREKEREKENKRNNVPLIIIEIVLVIVLILIVINLLGIPARLNQIMK